MEKKKFSYKKDLFPVIIMGCLFILIYSLSITLTEPFIEAGIEPVWGEEGKDDPVNVLQIIAIMLIITVAILLIAKYLRKYMKK